LFQPPIQPFVGYLADIWREFMLAIWISRRQFIFIAEQLVDRLRSGDAVLHSRYLEVIIVDRGAGQEGTRGKGGDPCRDVEGLLRRLELVHTGEGRDETLVGADWEMAAIILGEAIEAAVGYQGLDARVKGGGEHAVAAAERMADAADALRVYFRQ